ncbi:MAG TPA: hypothetical protein VND88_10960 [Candidatus Acidoferrales bacterium]|nr:hypothetical protein [Candidatus Acidoferrales bacterium]
MPERALTSFRKVPEVTVAFWIAKVLTTGMGEATSDLLVHQLAPIVAVAIGAVGLTISLVVQFAVGRYNAWTYWLAVAMVAIFGTMAATSSPGSRSPSSSRCRPWPTAGSA